MKNILKNHINALRSILVLFLSLGVLFFTPVLHSTNNSTAFATENYLTPTTIRPEKGVAIEFTVLDAETGKGVSGGVYRVANLDTEVVIENVIPDSSGFVRLENLTVGQYNIDEMTAPKGYSTRDTRQVIQINNDNEAHSFPFYTLKKIDYNQNDGKLDFLTPTTVRPEKGVAIEFTVLDAETGQGVSGGVYRVANINTGVVIENVKPDASGFVRLENLTVGRYNIDEMTAPEGYLTFETRKTIQINNDNETHSFPFYTLINYNLGIDLNWNENWDFWEF